MARVALLAGTTAGHVYLALAVAEALRQRDSGGDLLFLGADFGGALGDLQRGGYRVETVPGSAFLRVGAAAKLAALLNALRGALAARRILRHHKIEVVVSFGGYGAAGAGLAAVSLGLPLLIQEGNVLPGLANRLLGRLAQCVALSYPDTGGYFDATRTEVTGTPVRRGFAELAATRTQPHTPARLLISGGSFGSSLFNRVGPELARAILSEGLEVEVWHLTGTSGDPELVRAAYAAAGVQARVEANTADMPAAVGWADFGLSSAGITPSECAAAGLPLFIVPLAWASEDHQRHNAEEFVRRSGSAWTDEASWDTATVAQQIGAVLHDVTRWRRAVAEVQRAAPGDAARRVATLALQLVRPASD